jgi:Family of unknown function (DUF6188)
LIAIEDVETLARIHRLYKGSGGDQATGNGKRYIRDHSFDGLENDGLVLMPCREKSKCMTDQKLIEHWIQGCAVQRIMFRDGLVLNLEDYNELVISTPITLTMPATANSPVEAVSIDPNDPAVHERPLFDFSGATCTDVSWDDTGDLHLEFSDGHQIDVLPDDNVTAWELYGKYHGYAACLPHGKVRVVRHDVADASED